LEPETNVVSLNVITPWDVLYEEGFLYGSDHILVVLQVMFPYVLRLLTLQFEEPTGKEEFLGASSILVQMFVSFL
jgi:hypothetical protein